MKGVKHFDKSAKGKTYGIWRNTMVTKYSFTFLKEKVFWNLKYTGPTRPSNEHLYMLKHECIEELYSDSGIQSGMRRNEVGLNNYALIKRYKHFSCIEILRSLFNIQKLPRTLTSNTNVCIL